MENSGKDGAVWENGAEGSGGRPVDTRAYVSALRQLVREGKEVSMRISGSSMAPFLIHARDSICFRAPDGELRRGDMVFFERDSGQFVMHRIRWKKPEGYYMIGDGQTETEGPVRRDQIFAVVTKVCRGGKWLKPGDFWWEFFRHFWLGAIPLRGFLVRLYGLFGRRKGGDA